LRRDGVNFVLGIANPKLNLTENLWHVIFAATKFIEPEENYKDLEVKNIFETNTVRQNGGIALYMLEKSMSIGAAVRVYIAIFLRGLE